MKLEEYFLMRNGLNMKGQPKKALSKGEARILGLDMTKKGWAKTDQDYSEDLIKKCVHHVLKSDWINIKARNKVSEFVKNTQFSTDLQKLYLLKNTENLYRIGISKDPFKRAQSLANAGGYKIAVVAVWELPMALKQEQELHKVFKKQRAVGEWFSGIFDHTTIEQHITQDFERVYTAT